MTTSNGGTATGCSPGGTKPCWKIHDGQGTAIIDPEHKDDCVLITASYVVLRNFYSIRDCKADGIKITSADAVVENNTIPDDFGRFGDTGIKVERAKRGVVIQRNVIKDPRYRSTRWEECAIWESHASGPHAITISGAKTAAAQGNVIRYNNIFATNTTASGGSVTLSQPANRYYDVINVNYNQDLDIYGNIIRNATDDAIEADNYAVNVRIWDNYLDYNPKNISFERMEAGPAYVFRNIFDRGDDSDFDSSPGTPGTYHMTLPGSGRDSKKVLMLESDNGNKTLAVANGPVNYYHNTSLRTGPDGFWNTAYIGAPTKALLPPFNLTLKNNIWMTNQHYIYDDQPADYVQYVFDGEMYNKPSLVKDSNITYTVTNALGPVTATWKSGHGPASIWTAPETPSGKYMATNAGTGVAIANFNDSASRGRGAHQYNANADNPMTFGTGASWTYVPSE